MNEGRNGPHLRIVGSCLDCKFLETYRSRGYGDSDRPMQYSCLHKQVAEHMPQCRHDFKNIGYSPETPSWCPLLAEAKLDFINKLEYEYCENI